MSNSSSSSSSSIKWLWPADRESVGFHVAHEHMSRIGTYAMAFKTREPLKEKDVSLALWHLQRKCHNLRVTLRRRGDTYWFCEPSPFDVDFKVVHNGGSIQEELEKVQEEGIINTEVAPWKMRLIPRGEDLSGSFPYKYDIMFLGHHAIGDGVSAGMLLHFMFELINDVLNGAEIDDEQYSQFAHNEELWHMEETVKRRLAGDSQRFEVVKQTLPPPDRIPLFLQAFPRPTGASASSGHTVRVLDCRVTANLHKKCKANGVTFNSAFTAAVNTAVMKLVKGAGIGQKNYRIASTHAVNIRRYLKKTPPSSLGGYALMYSYMSNVDEDVDKGFWQYCKVVNEELKGALQSGLPLEQKMALLMTGPPVPPEELFRDPPPIIHDFGVTNVGNFPSSDPESEDHLFIENISCYNFVQKFIHMNFFQVVSFRGRCSFTLSYATNYIAEETAILLADEVMSVLQEASEFSRL